MLIVPLWFGCFSQEAIGAFPNVELRTLDGSKINTSEIKNGNAPMLIIVWATWCHHAMDGMSSISDDYYSDWVEEYNLKIIGVSVDDMRNIPKVAPLVNGKGWEFEHYIDQNADFKRSLGINAPPHLFIVNANREIIWSFNSFNPGDELEISKMLSQIKN